MSSEKYSLRTRPLVGPSGAHTFGVEVGDFDIATADTMQLEAVARLWSDVPLVLVRGQLLDEAALMRFSQTFGDLETVVRKDIHSPYNPQVALVSNLFLEDGTNIGGLGNYELRWHTDQSYRTCPATGAIFFAIEMPPEGGNTRWINTQMAYEALDPAVRLRIEGRRGLFAYTMYDTDITSESETQSIRSRTPDAFHPLVLEHPRTGERCLYFDPTQTFDIEGLSEDDALATIALLREHLMDPRFQQVHAWRMGDVMMWDNARLLHSRDAFDQQHPRLAKRTTIFLKPELFPVPARRDAADAAEAVSA